MARLFLVALVGWHSALVAAQMEGPQDMACGTGPRAAQWGKVKARFRAAFDGAGGPFKAVAPEALAAVVKESIDEMNAVRGLSTDADAVNECGFGKLFIQLASLVTVEEPNAIVQYFQERPNVASPVLTMLLDIPWFDVARSGWPFFGVLANINYQKARIVAPLLNSAAIDGLANEAIQAYFDVMSASKEGGDMLAMAAASQMFLRDLPAGSPYATLTAMATQCAISMDIKERLKGIQTLQDLFRQSMTTPSELDIALTVRWPLWGFLHVSVDVFADVP